MPAATRKWFSSAITQNQPTEVAIRDDSGPAESAIIGEIFWVSPAMMNIGSGDNDCRKQLFARRVLDTNTASLGVADYKAELAGIFGNIS